MAWPVLVGRLPQYRPTYTPLTSFGAKPVLIRGIFSVQMNVARTDTVSILLPQFPRDWRLKAILEYWILNV